VQLGSLETMSCGAWFEINIPVTAIDRLKIDRRVPVTIKKYHTVCSDKVDSKAASIGRKQKQFRLDPSSCV